MDQLITPDHIRGRMSSVNVLFAFGGPQLGEIEAGIAATLLGAPLSVVSGGGLAVLFTITIFFLVPQLRNYTSDKNVKI